MGWKAVRRPLRALLIFGLTGFVFVEGAFGLETKTVGEDKDSWETGGGGIAPEWTEDYLSTEVGNTPGGVVDFDVNPGWIVPKQTDPTVNIALGTLERGGKVISPNASQSDKTDWQMMVDGDSTTAFTRKDTPAVKVNPLGVLINLDLGARFGVNRIRFFPRNAGVTGTYDPSVPTSPENPFHNDFMRSYELYLNDGTEESLWNGFPLWTLVKSEDENTESVVDLPLDLQYVRHVRVASRTTIDFEIDEIEVYGRGFVPAAQYISDMFDLGDLATWGNLRWQEDFAGNIYDTQALINTRSGNDDTPFVYYRKEEGQEEETPLDVDGSTPLTKKTYDALPDAEKGAIKDDTENWSPWSAPYSADLGTSEEGVLIVSPGPRQYFQFRIKLFSEDLNSARSVEFVSFEYSKPPVAEKITAEIFPRKVEPGAATRFTYAVLADIREGTDTGFDSFQITTPVRISSVDRIEIVDANGNVVSSQEFGEDIEELLAAWEAAGDPTAPLLAKGDDFAIQSVTDKSFVVRFPKIVTDRTVLKISFQDIVLRFGTTFTGRASDWGAGELSQLAVAGNSANLGEADVDALSDLAVQISLGGALIREMAVSPNPFTPNGDNVNDDVELSYNILKLTGKGARVDVAIYDLSGRLVKTVISEDRASGHYGRDSGDVWDGTDDSGELVSPGIYLFRISVESDAEPESAAGVVSVVY